MSIKISNNKFLYYFNRLQTYIFCNDGFLYGYNNFKIIKSLKKYKPDIIHIHNVHNSFMNIEKIIKFAVKNKIKLIWTLHDTWALTGRCGAFGVCNKWSNGCGSCQYRKIYPKSLFDLSRYFFKKKRNMIKKYKQYVDFVVPSFWLSNLLEKNLNISCRVIANGIEQSVFKRTLPNKTISEFANGRQVIGGAAFDFNELKGFGDFKKLNETINKSKTCIVLIGMDILKPRISEGILFLPRTTNKHEMASFYSSLDWFFNPTKMETFGLTNIESLSCLTPVITYKAGGTTEVVSAIPGGYVVEQGDIDAVIKIINNEKPEVDQNSIKKFDKKNTIHSYLELYK